MIATIFNMMLPVLFMIIYVGIIVYFVSLAIRLVRAVERIADKIEDSRPQTGSENL